MRPAKQPGDCNGDRPVAEQESQTDSGRRLSDPAAPTPTPVPTIPFEERPRLPWRRRVASNT